MTIQPFLEPHRMMVAAAPEPNDVSWKTLHPSYTRLLITRGVVIVFLTLMAIAWGFPTFFCASTVLCPAFFFYEANTFVFRFV